MLEIAKIANHRLADQVKGTEPHTAAHLVTASSGH